MMLTIKQMWRTKIQVVLKSFGYEVPDLAGIQIEARKRAKKGQYSTPIALKTAVQLRMDPFDLAQKLQQRIPGTTVSSNAYLNFSCGPEQLWSWFLGLKSQALNVDCPQQETLSYYRKRLDLMISHALVQEAKAEDFFLLNELDFELGLGLADFLDDYFYQYNKDRAWETFFKVLQAYFNQMVLISEDMKITRVRIALINTIRSFLF